MALIERKKLFTIIFFILETLISRAMSDTSPESLEPDLIERYEIWRAQYGRNYPNSADQEKRFNIFKDNVEFIDKINNEGNRAYKLGANKFADLTHEEFLASYTKKKNSSGFPSSVNIKRYNFNAPLDEVPPDSLDWRERGAVTAVRNQGDACPASGWAFATVAGIEGILKRVSNNLVELSLQQLIDCSPAGNCNGGSAGRAYTYVRDNKGITLEEYYPYHQSQGTCDQQKATTLQVFQISGNYGSLLAKEAELLKAVATTPVSVAIDAGSREFQLYGSGVFTGPCGINPNHDVAAVGYGRSPEGTKYWIMKNSWGTGWGEDGFMRILRDNPGSGLCGLNQQFTWPFIDKIN